MQFTSPELGFAYGHTFDEKIKTENFKLHNHREYHEIYVFLQGDAEFLVEGTRYPLHPNDIILAQNFEMHNVQHKSNALYERLVITISNNFFVKHNCESYQEIFVNRPLGVGNCIPAETALAYGIPELLKRTEHYLSDEAGGAAALGTILELLYLFNRIGAKKRKTAFYNEQIKNVILYINEHLAEPLPLDALAEHFYITKCHLCRSFKTHTGYTVNQYITHKRLLQVRELIAAGRSWTEASAEAGFGNYSNFYKQFCRAYGHAPSAR